MPGSPIGWLAYEAGLDYLEVWNYLRREIARRRRQRYAMHTHAYEQLDARLDRPVAANGNGAETTPGPHHHGV